MVVHAINFAGYSHNPPGYFHPVVLTRARVRGSRLAPPYRMHLLSARGTRAEKDFDPINGEISSGVQRARRNLHAGSLNKDRKQATGETPVFFNASLGNRLQ